MIKPKQERLREVYEHLRQHFGVHTQIDFAKVLGLTRPAISAAMNGNEAYLTDNLFKRICAAYQGVFNLDYLLTGNGQLLNIREEVTKEELQINPPHPSSYVNKLIASLEKQIKDKDDQLADKERIIRLLEQKIEMLEAMQHIDAGDLLHSPFPMGVADKNEKITTRV